MFHIDENDLKYLSGELFSSIYQLRIQGKSESLGRISLVAKLVKDKRVIHFGCVDHLPLVEQRIQDGEWLHGILAQQCASLVGVDINEAGIQYIREKGFEVFNSNVITENPPKEILGKKWDFLVAGEVLEHIDNPVMFLESIRMKYHACTERIIITVPNALSYTNFRFGLRGTEMINSDHRFWFTPFTLIKVAMQAGIKVEAYDLCSDHAPMPFSVKWWLGDKPLLRNRIVLVGKM